MYDDLEFKNNYMIIFSDRSNEEKDICISRVGRSKDISLVFVKQSVEDLKKNDLNDREDNKIKDIENNLKYKKEL